MHSLGEEFGVFWGEIWMAPCYFVLSLIQHSRNFRGAKGDFRDSP